MRPLFTILMSFLLLISCEKEIDLNLDDRSGSIVIEGNITDQPGPYTVRITKSVAFTSDNLYPPVENATVMITSSSEQSEELQYAGAGVYKTHLLVGKPGETYNLKVNYDGKIFSAQSTMPQSVDFDGLEQDSFKVGSEISYTLLPIFTDPQALGNNYLFSYFVNGRSKKNFLEFSDNVNNGLPNQRPLILPNDDKDGSEKVKIGDEVQVEMYCIDAKVFTYYSALLSLSSGSVTPTNPPSNISNGALGYFSAHTVRVKKAVIE